MKQDEAPETWRQSWPKVVKRMREVAPEWCMMSKRRRVDLRRNQDKKTKEGQEGHAGCTPRRIDTFMQHLIAALWPISIEQEPDAEAMDRLEKASSKFGSRNALRMFLDSTEGKPLTSLIHCKTLEWLRKPRPLSAEQEILYQELRLTLKKQYSREKMLVTLDLLREKSLGTSSPSSPSSPSPPSPPSLSLRTLGRQMDLDDAAIFCLPPQFTLQRSQVLLACGLAATSSELQERIAAYRRHRQRFLELRKAAHGGLTWRMEHYFQLVSVWREPDVVLRTESKEQIYIHTERLAQGKGRRVALQLLLQTLIEAGRLDVVTFLREHGIMGVETVRTEDRLQSLSPWHKLVFEQMLRFEKGTNRTSFAPERTAALIKQFCWFMKYMETFAQEKARQEEEDARAKPKDRKTQTERAAESEVAGDGDAGRAGAGNAGDAASGNAGDCVERKKKHSDSDSHSHTDNQSDTQGDSDEPCLQRFFRHATVLDLENALRFGATQMHSRRASCVEQVRHHAHSGVSRALHFLRGSLRNHLGTACRASLPTLNAKSILCGVASEQTFLPQTPRRTFTNEEVAAMLEVARDPAEVFMITILREIGLRACALGHLTYNMLLTECHTPRIECRVPEKGKKLRVFKTSENLQAKTKALSDFLRSIYSDKDLCHSYPLNLANISKPMSIATVNNVVRRLAHNAGVYGPHVHTHSFRHTLVGTLVAAGNPIELVSKFMGHSGSGTTSYFYWKPTTDEVAAQMINPFSKAYYQERQERQEKITQQKQNIAVHVEKEKVQNCRLIIDTLLAECDPETKARMMQKLPNLHTMLETIDTPVALSEEGGDSDHQEDHAHSPNVQAQAQASDFGDVGDV